MRESRERHLLYLGLCAALIPVLLLRDFTPSNELRYLSIADEALRNGTFFAFTDHGVPFTDKPPLYLWIVMLCRWLTGAHRMWLLGLFSLVPAIVIARVIDKWTVHDLDSEGRSIARLMLITSGIFFVSAMTIRMDMLMTLFIVLALREFWMIHSCEPGVRHCCFTFPLYIFLAMFTKGPLGFILAFAVTVVYLIASGNGRKFFRYWGWRTWSVLIILTALWFLGMYLEGGASYLHDFIVNQTVNRTFESLRHGRPFYYYCLTIWYILAPWTLLVLGIVMVALHPKFVKSAIQTFFLTAGVTIFVVLSCVDQKMQIYMLPAVPFLIYGAAMFLTRFHDNHWIRLSLAIPSAMIMLSLPTLVWAAATFPKVEYLNNGLIYAAATVLTLAGGNALYHLYGKEKEHIIVIVRRIAGGIGLAVFVAAWSLPKVGSDIGYGKLCRKTNEIIQKTGITDVYAESIEHAENMDALLNRPVRIVNGKATKDTNRGKPFLLLVPQSDLNDQPGKDVKNVGPYAIVVCK